MAVAYTISQCNDMECYQIVQLLKSFDDNVDKKVQYVSTNYNLTYKESLEYVVTNNPVLWAKVYLDWEARDYQMDMLKEMKQSRSLVLRLGRRLGKSECMCVSILWHAYTQINRGPNNQYDILVFTPYETQIDLIFKRLHQLIDISPVLKTLISRDVHHNLQFSINGVTSNILGLTAGANNSAGGANSTRGQRADLIVLDECDYIGGNQITNIINIRNEAPERIKIMAASTPSGKHEEYYKWCVGATKKYAPKPEDIENYRFTGYEVFTKPAGKGNGWTEIFAPSVVNKELLKVNPDTQKTYLEDLKSELTEVRYEQEVMAGFGEEELGVYQKKYIRLAVEEGEASGYSYLTEWPKEDVRSYIRRARALGGMFMLGVDWDRVQADTQLVGVEYIPFFRNVKGKFIGPRFRVIFRVPIPRGEFTFTEATNKIIQLNNEYMFDYIGIDRGFGDTQVEILKKYGLEHPESHLTDNIVPIQFSQKINVRDPYTLKKTPTPVKPFMVNNSVKLFESNRIILNPKDDYIINQLEEYRVKSISTTGQPIYSDTNEHAVDCINLALLAFAMNNDDLLRKMFTMAAIGIGDLDSRNVDVKSRAISDSKQEDENPIVQVIKTSEKEKIITITPISRNKVTLRNNVYRRRTF